MRSRASTTWVSGSPKRALNSMTRRPREVSARPAYTTPTNGVPRWRSSSTVGCTTRSTTSSHEAGRRPRQRRVGAHAAGVGAEVAVGDALEVLRRLQRHDVLAVREAEQRHLGAVEVLLDHAPGRRACRGRPARARAAAVRSSVTTTPLPAARPSSLTTYGAPNCVEGDLDLVDGRRTRAPWRSGTPAAAMTSLAKALLPSSAPRPRRPGRRSRCRRRAARRPRR